jgi:methionyl-tRNA formyltransferase
MTGPRVLFAGTPEFALASLRALVDRGFVPVAVLTQPDRPAGRGKKLAQSPVKQFAIERGIDVLQPQTLRDRDIVAELTALEPDILVVAAYGLILPQDVLDIPRSGCLNVHASLLPRWRGAAPIQAAILNGDPQTGITLMSMTAGLDCGPVYAAEALDIGAEETAGELHDRLAELGGCLLLQHFDSILDGSLPAAVQDESQATYAPKISKDDARIDWRAPATELLRRVRAYNPVPGAWFELDGQRIKCWQASRADTAGAAPGTVLSADKNGVVVACGDGALSLESLQRPGKGRVTGPEFAAAVDLRDRQLDSTQ